MFWCVTFIFSKPVSVPWIWSVNVNCPECRTAIQTVYVKWFSSSGVIQPICNQSMFVELQTAQKSRIECYQAWQMIYIWSQKNVKGFSKLDVHFYSVLPHMLFNVFLSRKSLQLFLNKTVCPVIVFVKQWGKMALEQDMKSVKRIGFLPCTETFIICLY